MRLSVQLPNPLPPLQFIRADSDPGTPSANGRAAI